ncbi:MAG: hypothetical protein NT158_09935 [Cyanobacteria bacterium]|nr:hypothetical protein [Cyanobacteriota bacterium]
MALPGGKAAQLGGAQASINSIARPRTLVQTLCQRRAGDGAVGDAAAGLWLMDGHSLNGLWHVRDAPGAGPMGAVSRQTYNPQRLETPG